MSLDNLPVEWTITEIGQVIEDMFGGLSPKTTDYQASGVIALNKGDIKQSGVLKLKNSANYLSEDFIGTSSDKVVQKDDVLVTLRDLSQKADFLGLVALYKGTQKAVITQGMYKILLNEALERRYLMWYSNSPLYRLQVKNEKVGATQVHLRNDQFKNLNIPLPPLSEQQEIVRQLDLMLAQVEQIKARLDAIPAILKKFRQSVLADAVSGKLLEQDIHFTMYKLSEISEFQNGYAFKSNWFTKEGDYQVIKLGNIRDDYLYIENAPSFVGVEIANQFKKFKPNVGDLLISMTGTRFKQDYGYVCQVIEDSNLLINQRVGRIIPNTKIVNSSYLLLCLRSDLFRQGFFKGETGGVNQGNVGSKYIEQIEINIPSLEFQDKIVALTDVLFRSVENIDTITKAAQKRVKLLTQSILAKAFSGELTAEWREQHQELITGINSVESLLAKIQAEREASKPVKKARAKKDNSA